MFVYLFFTFHDDENGEECNIVKATKKEKKQIKQPHQEYELEISFRTLTFYALL